MGAFICVWPWAPSDSPALAGLASSGEPHPLRPVKRAGESTPRSVPQRGRPGPRTLVTGDQPSVVSVAGAVVVAVCVQCGVDDARSAIPSRSDTTIRRSTRCPTPRPMGEQPPAALADPVRLLDACGPPSAFGHAFLVVTSATLKPAFCLLIDGGRVFGWSLAFVGVRPGRSCHPLGAGGLSPRGSTCDVDGRRGSGRRVCGNAAR